MRWPFAIFCGVEHIGTLAQLIELAGGLLIGGYVAAALWALLRGRAAGIPRARSLIATGAIAGLDFKLAAALLKTLQLHTWSQLGMFAAILALRILLKRVFTAEARPAPHTGSEAAAIDPGERLR